MKINETQESRIQYVVTSSYPPIMFQATKKAFNFIAGFVQIFIVRPSTFHTKFWRYANGRSFQLQTLDNFVGWISSVRQHDTFFNIDSRNLFIKKWAVIDISSRQIDFYRSAFFFGGDMNFGSFTAFWNSYTSAPFWTTQGVLMNFDKGAIHANFTYIGLLNLEKIFSKMPSFVQREKHW